MHDKHGRQEALTKYASKKQCFHCLRGEEIYLKLVFLQAFWRLPVSVAGSDAFHLRICCYMELLHTYWHLDKELYFFITPLPAQMFAGVLINAARMDNS